MDQIQLELVISTQVDRLLTGLSSFERSLNNVEKAHGSAAAKADTHSAALEKFGGSLQRVANLANLFAAFETVKGALSVFDDLERHNIDLLRTTEILGGNATAASTWSVAAHEMGINLDVIDRAFAKLSTALNSTGNPALKQMGIAAEDSAGKLRPLNDIINQAANYFQAHAGATNNAALANLLFGRSGYELLPVLEQGQLGLARLTEEARKYGLILDGQTIERNAAFTFQLKEAQLAADGLGLALGNAALPGLAALGQALSKVVEDNLPSFIAMINRAVSYLVGFVEGISGMKLEVGQGALALSSLSNITGDTGSAMDSAAGSGQALADAIQKIRDRTKDATDAIDDQVAALNAQAQARNFAVQQEKLQEQLASKSHDIDKLRKKQYEEFWLGNFQTAMDVGDQITQVQQSQADLAEQINTNTLNQQSKDQVSALQTQKQSIEEAANKQIAAMQRAAKGTSDAMSAGFGAIPAMAANAGLQAGLGFANDFGAEQIGEKMGQQLQDALLGPIIGYKTSGRGGNTMTAIRGDAQWQAIGQAIGDAIASGLTTALGRGFERWLANVKTALIGNGGPPGASRLVNPARQGGTTIYGSDDGALFTRPTLTWVAESRPEAVVPAGHTAPGASRLPSSDTAEIERLLRMLIEVVSSSGGGSGSAGLQAALFNAIDGVKRNRNRGMVGV